MSRKTINCNIHMCSWQNTRDELLLPPNENFKLIIGYPLDKDVFFKIKSKEKGTSFAKLTNEIVNIYKKIYKDPDKYMVYGHDIGDLSIQKIRIDYKKKEISLDIGS